MKVEDILNLTESKLKKIITKEEIARLKKVGFDLKAFLDLYQLRARVLNRELEWFSVSEFVNQIEENYTAL